MARFAKDDLDGLRICDQCCPAYCTCPCHDVPTEAERAAATEALARLREKLLTPSADMPACRDEDPARAATLAVCYPPDYQHPEDDDGGAFDMAPGHGGW